MNRIHSGILAIVLSIFLIQATDPPYEINPGTLLQYSTINDAVSVISKNKTPDEPTSTEVYAPKTSIDAPVSESASEIPSYVVQQNLERLRLLHHYLSNINSNQQSQGKENVWQHKEKPIGESATHAVINKFLQREGKSEYEKLLEKDFVRPLLQLYESQQQGEGKSYSYGNFTTNGDSRISKEDTVEELTSISKEDLELLMHQENYYPTAPSQQIRRDDNVDNTESNPDQEHIGEILPLDYKVVTNKKHPSQLTTSRNRGPLQVKKYNPHVTISLRSTRKSYEFENQGFRPTFMVENPDLLNRYRQPIRVQGERFRPEYEPSMVSSEGYEVFYSRPEAQSEVPVKEDVRNMYARPLRGSLPSSEALGYRTPRRLRGFRDAYQEVAPNIGRDQYYDPGPKQQYQPLGWGARRPRVIFPTDLVAFKEPNQEEPDWLAADASLQDIQEQEQDSRDRGNF